MIDHPNVAPSPELLSQESEIYRRQKILFVLIDILFTFNLVTLFAFIHLYKTDRPIDEPLKLKEYFFYKLLWVLLSLVYDIFGLIATYLCHRICLRVFTCIGIIFLILNCCALGHILFWQIQKIKSAQNNWIKTSSRYVIFVIFWISITSVLYISLRLSFRLSKLIKNLQHNIMESVSISEIK
ncbi:unnamed protein product [Adineta steineri]|uniref:Uncharacterized protein n=1 Tax=Adineta steineri TaxID=433720 RepID=A0A814ASA8_9BILA|nr:unnamed protein product [Adineta steineri]CAF0980943.1 unnamed protein product [Adineta steineri]